MAIETGAIYRTRLFEEFLDKPTYHIIAEVVIPHRVELTEDEAKLLEHNIHNALELVLERYFH